MAAAPGSPRPRPRPPHPRAGWWRPAAPSPAGAGQGNRPASCRCAHAGSRSGTPGGSCRAARRVTSQWLLRPLRPRPDW
ncbi:hypothetical protein ABB31_19610, partial [Stenotrophomonas pavanii]